jgi:hypothetical protein
MGLAAPANTYPLKFSWLERSISSTYRRWATGFPSEAVPNGNCAGANATMIGMSPPVWGWGNSNCMEAQAFMCRITSERRLEEQARSVLIVVHALVEARADAGRLSLTSRPRPPAAPGTASFTAPSSGATYVVNTKPATFDAAEAFCNRNGGHLASFKSLEEQNETETYFIASGEGVAAVYCTGVAVDSDAAAALNSTTPACRCPAARIPQGILAGPGRDGPLAPLRLAGPVAGPAQERLCAGPGVRTLGLLHAAEHTRA